LSIINSFYKLLNATIGSNLEALFAGKTPKIKPIDPEMIMVEIVVVIPTDAGSGVIRDKIKHLIIQLLFQLILQLLIKSMPQLKIELIYLTV